MNENIRKNYDAWLTAARKSYFQSSRFVNDVREYLTAHIGDQKLLLAPAGETSYRFGQAFKEPLALLGYYDKQVKERQETPNRQTIYPLEELPHLAPCAVIITSLVYADQIEADIKNALPDGRNTPIIKIRDLLHRFTGPGEPQLQIREKQPIWQIGGQSFKRQKRKIQTIQKILFVRNVPCIRIYKMAYALTQKGYQVFDAYSGGRYEEHYHMDQQDLKMAFAGDIQIKGLPHLVQLSREFHLLHCHNRPDLLTLMALAGNAPVIHDAHEVTATPPAPPLESYETEELANTLADGKIYQSASHRDILVRRYSIPTHNTLVFTNYALGKHIPNKLKPKLAPQMDEIHVVYQGLAGISTNVPRHRQFNHIFQTLTANRIHVHIYTQYYDKGYKELSAKNQYLHYHNALNPRELISEISQYDFGILPFPYEEGTRDYLDGQMPHKLFEYMAARLPIISSPGEAKEKFITANNIGVIYDDIETLIPQLPHLKSRFARSAIDVSPYTFEGNIHKVIDFYEKIVQQYNKHESRG